MTVIEKFVDELEAQESAEEMYFSIYYVPEYYQPQEASYD